MPSYTIKDQFSGKVIKVSGDSPPSEKEILQIFASQNNETQTISTKDSVPEWGAKNPNLYGIYGAGRELLRTGLETGGATLGEVGGTFVPVPGSSYVGGGMGFAIGKRAANAILGDESDNSMKGIGTDVALGATQVGIGKLISKIPGFNKVLSPSAANVGNIPKASNTAEKTAYNLMEKSVKVPPSNMIGGVRVNREQAINTLLNEKIPIRKGGLDRVKTMIDDLGDQMDYIVANTPNKNAPIQIDDVLAPVNELKLWASKTVNGTQQANKIQRVIDNFKKQYGDVITVGQAQEIKQNTNAFLKKSYGELKPVTEEATKQIVRGLREKISQEIPEMVGVNAKYGEMKNLERVLERAVNRTGNWDWFSLSAGMAGSIVGGATGSLAKATEAVGIWRLLKSPVVQSELALMFKRMGKGKEANAMANAIANTIYHKLTSEQSNIEQ